jgi:UDP-N-acetylmuramoyl-tripeptide--D-alanyl-D-alanine ligase
MKIADLYSLFKTHPEVTTDSRHCPTGSIFFALRGDSFNGNRFAAQALANGCSYAVIDEAEYLLDHRTLLFDDALRALQGIAMLHRKAMKATVIGITGTNGKTTTKELMAAVLSTKYRTLYTQGNLNNHIGVPLTLLQLRYSHEFAVIEMGASHPGDIRDLAMIADPDYGIVTNVGRAHLEGFGSFEGVVRAKTEMYEYILRKRGRVFINQDDRTLLSVSKSLKKIPYGYISRKDPLVGGVLTGSDPYVSLRWKHRERGEFNIKTHLVGDYNLMNALAAIAAGTYFDISPEEINGAIESYRPSNNRSQLLHTRYNLLVIDAYNANPSSMRAAIENFIISTSYPKALILGDMLELGEQSAALHAEILQLVGTGKVESVLLCGSRFGLAAAGKGYRCFADVEELKDYLDLHPLQGYNILVKGSHGMHLETIMEKL